MKKIAAVIALLQISVFPTVGCKSAPVEYDRSWRALLQPEEATVYFSRWPGQIDAFDPSKGPYDSINAWWLAEISRLVYRRDAGDEHESNPQSDGHTRKGELGRVGWEELCFLAGDRAQCNVARPKTSGRPFVVVAFRGTHDLEDVFTDLKFDQASWDGDARVHAGFKEAFDQIWARLEAVLKSNPGDVVFTGHSLGGALASLAATRHRPQALYTFGCPRVGNKTFAGLLSGLGQRVVNQVDVVPTVPPDEFGYGHGGTLHTVGESAPPSNLVPGEDWWREFFAQKHQDLRGELTKASASPPSYLSDHAPINYLTAIDHTLGNGKR